MQLAPITKICDNIQCLVISEFSAVPALFSMVTNDKYPYICGF